MTINAPEKVLIGLTEPDFHRLIEKGLHSGPMAEENSKVVSFEIIENALFPYQIIVEMIHVEARQEG